MEDVREKIKNIKKSMNRTMKNNNNNRNINNECAAYKGNFYGSGVDIAMVIPKFAAYLMFRELILE